MTTQSIKTRIIKIGNSKGIRIPKFLLDQLGLAEEVELSLGDNQLIIQSVRPVRYNWDEQFQQMAEKGDDYLLDDEIVSAAWDNEEWDW